VVFSASGRLSLAVADVVLADNNVAADAKVIKLGCAPAQARLQPAALKPTAFWSRPPAR
jgi:beta-glucosidase